MLFLLAKPRVKRKLPKIVFIKPYQNHDYELVFIKGMLSNLTVIKSKH